MQSLGSSIQYPSPAPKITYVQQTKDPKIILGFGGRITYRNWRERNSGKLLASCSWRLLIWLGSMKGRTVIARFPVIPNMLDQVEPLGLEVVPECCELVHWPLWREARRWDPTRGLCGRVLQVRFPYSLNPGCSKVNYSNIIQLISMLFNLRGGARGNAIKRRIHRHTTFLDPNLDWV